jgi:hypothetical protein
MSVRPNIRATLYSATITAALTAVAQTSVTGLTSARYLVLHANFVYGSGGTSADVWVQTSIDGGLTWYDIANFHFTTASGKKVSSVAMDPATPLPPGTVPASGALAANTVLNGAIGDRVRALVTTVGTYAGGTTLAIDMVAKG